MSQQTWIPGPNGDNATAIKAVIDDNFTELYKRDAGGYGFSPSASASVNRAALQLAFDYGGLITIITPGTYDLDDTLYIGSNTKLICSPGVILRKTGDYSNILLNKGALTKVYDENIEIVGLEISVNGVDNITEQDVEGLRAQVGFYYVSHLVFKNFKCTDLASLQFCLTLITWKHVYFQNIHIEGEKDGIDLGPGHDGVFEDFYFKTNDDAILLYTQGYSTATVEVGDIYNVTFKNFVDDFKTPQTGNTVRLLNGSWDDWTLNNEYQSADLVINAGNLYICMLAVAAPGATETGTVAPVHGSGTVTGADNIPWRYLQACDFYYADIYNVTFDNCINRAERRTLYTYLTGSEFQRPAYPGTETLSSIYNLRFINSYIKDTKTTAFRLGFNVKDFTVSDCVLDYITAFIQSVDAVAVSVDPLDIVVTGCIFKNQSIAEHGVSMLFIQNSRVGETINCFMYGNAVYNVDFWVYAIDATTPIRLINPDVQLRPQDLDELTPEAGDICRTTEGLYIFIGTGYWKGLNETYGPNLVTNFQFETDSDWTKQAGWGIAGGKANCDGSQVANSMIYQAKEKESGAEFLHVFVLSGVTQGTIRVRGGALGTERSADGTYFERVTNTPDYNNNALRADVDFIGSVDEYMVYKIY